MYIKLHFGSSGEEFHLNTDKIIYFADKGQFTTIAIQNAHGLVAVRETSAEILKQLEGTKDVQ